MAKTTFVNGSIVSAAFLNSLQQIIFDAQELDGHYPKITNNDLSDAAGQIKPEWTTFRDALRVTAGSGLNVNVQAGSVTLPNDTPFSVAGVTLSLTDNAINYIYINESGQALASTTYPIVALPLARITTAGGTISSSIVDSRPRYRVESQAGAVKIFGGTGDQGDYTLSATETFDKGYYYFRNFTINPGATLTISKFAKIFCSGNVTINGAINITYLASGGAIFATSVIGASGGLSGSGPGAGSGSNALGGEAYNYAAATYGSGGAGGYSNFSSNSGGTLAGGGRGGGGLWIEAGGAITVGATISARGENGGTGVLTTGTGDLSGGGGGSGGLILLSSLKSVVVSPGTTLDVRGGNGGNAAAGNAKGGYGGGGGQVVLISPSINATGATISNSGGTAGSNTGTGALGGGNGGGFGGAGNAGTSGGGGAGLTILRNFRAVGN